MTETASEITDQQSTTDPRLIAHVGPFALFMVFLGLLDVLTSAGLVNPGGDGPWYQSHPKQWIYPLQTVVCLAMLFVWRRHYEFRPHTGWMLATGAGLLGIILWILPCYLFDYYQMSEGWWAWLGFTSRNEGFTPDAVAAQGSAGYAVVVGFRFLRLMVVVPLVEEIFWRGFLMRWLADIDGEQGDVWQVPFGTHHRTALIGTTLLFVLAHSSSDYLGATIYGLLTYAVAVRTKSLSACILMHAVANGVLGLYVLTTGQWGYW